MLKKSAGIPRSLSISHVMESNIELDERQEEIFGDVLRHLRYDQIASYASDTRCQIDPSVGTVDCVVLPKPQFGSYHAVLSLLFADGITWMLKVPEKGHCSHWTDGMAKAMDSEANTMRLIRQKTSIPVPKIYAFNTSLDNVVGCPFILMEMMPGKHLNHGWFDEDASQAKRERFRIKALQELAEAMAQLNSLTFHRGGCLQFDADGCLSGFGPRHFVDWNTVYDQVCTSTYEDPLPYCEAGPFQNAMAYYLNAMDKRKEQQNDTPFSQGLRDLLRLFIEWSLAHPGTANGDGFVLAHPDLDTQNIFTDENGSVTGIIDWECVGTVPHSIGCLALPKFLMRDYDPDHYHYDVKAYKSENGYDECSPAELSCYREMYAHFIESSLKSDKAANVTRRSLVASSLASAAEHPMNTINFVDHLFEESKKLDDADNHCSNTESEVSEAVCRDEGHSISEMSFEELLEEIERFTAPSLTNSSSHEGGEERVTAASFPLMTTQDEKVGKLKASYGRVIGQSACGWGSKKLRRAAECLHRRKSDLVEHSDTAKVSSVECNTNDSWMAGPFYWVRTKFRYAIEAMHHSGKTDRPSGAIGKKKLVKLIEFVQKKLGRLFHTLLVKHKDDKTGEDCTDQEIHPESVTNDPDVMSDQEKISTCRHLGRLLKENPRNEMSVLGRKVIARWIVTNLRPECSSKDDVGTEEKSDEESECGYRDFFEEEKAWEVKLQAKAAREAANYDAGENGAEISYFDIIFPNHNRAEEFESHGSATPNLTEPKAKTHRDLIDSDTYTQDLSTNNERGDFLSTNSGIGKDHRACQSHSSNNTVLETEDSDGVADEDAITEITSLHDDEESVSQNLTLDEKPLPGDMGGFTLWEICIALSKGPLDERRTKRLKAGFLALLNQTL